MLRFFIFFVLLFSRVALFGQLSTEKECKPTSGMEVVLEKSEAKIDTTKHHKEGSNFIDYSDPVSYRLKSLNKEFTVVSFVISAEDTEGDIIEANNQGEYLNGMSRNIITTKKPDSQLIFSCIKAKYKNGQIFTLQPLTVKL